MGMMDPIENTFCISITYVLHVNPYSPVILDSRPLSLFENVSKLHVRFLSPWLSPAWMEGFFNCSLGLSGSVNSELPIAGKLLLLKRGIENSSLHFSHLQWLTESSEHPSNPEVLCTEVPVPFPGASSPRTCCSLRPSVAPLARP